MSNLSKELRKQRRREEHKARKAVNRAGISAISADQQQFHRTEALHEPLTASASKPHVLPEFFALSDRKNTEREAQKTGDKERDTARDDRNRRNAQLSTGPRTPEGKATSSQNSFRHGLTGHFAVLPWEDMDRFVELAAQVHKEHQPATITEYSLVERMVQHLWLGQRALHLQNLCFNMDVPLCEQEKLLALYLRYGGTHDRAFHKCLAELLKLRATQRKEEAGFVSQQRQAAAERRKEELHNVRIAAANAKTAATLAKNTRSVSPKSISAPLPATEAAPRTPATLTEYPEVSATTQSQAA